MNKADLAGSLAERLGITKKQGEDVVDAFQAIVTDALCEQEDVTIAGFGTFSSRIRSARMGVNPQKPSERIRIPAVLVPKFKAGKALKDALKAAQKSDDSAPPKPDPTDQVPQDAPRPEEADVTRAQRAQDNTPDHMRATRPFQE